MTVITENRLRSILTEVQRQLTEKVQFLNKLQENLRCERKTVWEEGPRIVTSFEGAVNLSQQVDQLRHSEWRWPTQSVWSGNSKNCWLHPISPGLIFGKPVRPNRSRSISDLFFV